MTTSLGARMRRMVVAGTLTMAVMGNAAAQGPNEGALLRRIDSVVAEAMTRSKTPGMSVAVQHGATVILAKGYGMADLESSAPASANTVYRLGSVTKQFTALAIMQLVEAGKVRLDDEISAYLPDFPLQGHRVTVHHLLTHTSGIRNYTALGPRFWQDASRRDLSDAQMVALFKDEPFDFAPGARWNYSNSGYYLLGMIVEKASGLPYRQYLHERILTPLGLSATSYCDEAPVIPGRAQGYEVVKGQVVNDGIISMNTPGAAGAMCSTVLDLLKWQRALVEHRLISRASTERMRTVATLNDGKATTYAYGLGVGQLEGHRRIGHGGGINGFITQLDYFPADDLTVVVLGNLGGAPSGEVAGKVARLSLGMELEVPKDLPVAAAAVAWYVGTWDLGAQGTVEVVRDGDRLVLKAGGQEVPLKHQGNGVFIAAGLGGPRLTFLPAGARAEMLQVELGGTTLQGKRK
ncbi:MAG TPA: serine hydrolase domain-containing protein [Gemmatimonadales bacterium]